MKLKLFFFATLIVSSFLTMCADRNAELARQFDLYPFPLPNGTVVEQPQQALHEPLLAQAAPAAPIAEQPHEIALENRAMTESSPFFVTVPCICCCFFKQFVPG